MPATTPTTAPLPPAPGPTSEVHHYQLPHEISAARACTRRTLADWHLEALIDDMVLVLSELLGNAYTHAHATHCTVTLEQRPHEIRVAVFDPSAQPPIINASTNDTAECGRGLFLVAACSADWGVEVVDGGKRVWCVLKIPTAPQ